MGFETIFEKMKQFPMIGSKPGKQIGNEKCSYNQKNSSYQDEVNSPEFLDRITLCYTFFITMLQFCPPKPKELERQTFTA